MFCDASEPIEFRHPHPVAPRLVLVALGQHERVRLGLSARQSEGLSVFFLDRTAGKGLAATARTHRSLCLPDGFSLSFGEALTFHASEAANKGKDRCRIKISVRGFCLSMQ